MKKPITFFILFLLALFMVEMEPITLNHIVCHPDGASPQLHGLPFINHTNTPWVNSGEYSLYVKGYLLDLLFWYILFYFLFRWLSRIQINPKPLRIIRIILISLLLPFLVILLSFKFAVSANFEWTHSFDQQGCPVQVVFYPRD